MKADPLNSGAASGNRVETIRASVRCLIYSLVGFVPLVGLPFSVAAIVQAFRIRKSGTGDWNPAESYLWAGKHLAPIGFLTSILFLLFLLFVSEIYRDMGSCHSGVG
jgi:hypothetical protein